VVASAYVHGDRRIDYHMDDQRKYDNTDLEIIVDRVERKEGDNRTHTQKTKEAKIQRRAIEWYQNLCYAVGLAYQS
jgi:hypothetical protein